MSVSGSNVVHETCSESDPLCEIHLEIAHKWTMMMYVGEDMIHPVTDWEDGTLYAKQKNCQIDRIVNETGKKVS